MLSVAVHDWDGRADLIAYQANYIGFDRIILCVEDRHLYHRAENVVEAVATFQQWGMEVLLDPWGANDMFAGEATSRPSPNFLPLFVELGAHVEADGFFWDEPKGDNWLGTLHRATSVARTFAPDMRNVVGIQPERVDEFVYSGVIFDTQEIAISTYLFPRRVNTITISEVIAQVDKWHASLPPQASVWVQTWKLPAGREWIPAVMFGRWQALGRKINIWSWEADRTSSGIRSENYQLVWDNLTEAIQGYGE